LRKGGTDMRITRTTPPLLLAAMLLWAQPSRSIERDPACTRDAAADYKICRAMCREDFQVAKDQCRNVDHLCAEACPSGRQACVEGPLTALASRKATNCDPPLEEAKQACRAQYEAGSRELTTASTLFKSPHSSAAKVLPASCALAVRRFVRAWARAHPRVRSPLVCPEPVPPQDACVRWVNCQQNRLKNCRLHPRTTNFPAPPRSFAPARIVDDLADRGETRGARR